MTEFDFVLQVLRIYERADVHESLFWRVEDDCPRFLAICNDTFWWATADLEEITPENIAVLEQAAADLHAIDQEIYLSELFAARVRKMRPQKPCYTSMPAEVAALFDACGPERTDDDQ